MNIRLLTRALIPAAMLLAGCGSTLHTQVRTVSDAVPASGATYALVLSEAQAADIDAKRQARTVRANLVKQGFVESDAGEAAYHVRFAVTDAGDVESTQARLGVHHPTPPHTTTSQTTVAGVGVPGTQRTTVHPGTAGGYTSGVSRPAQDRHVYRAEISFIDNTGDEAKPVHKIVAEAESRKSALREIAPCLIDAAFREFPGKDGSKRRVRVDAGGCS